VNIFYDKKTVEGTVICFKLAQKEKKQIVYLGFTSRDTRCCNHQA